MTDNGYNPIRWNCEQQGCFNTYARPKVEQFAHLFGGRCSMGDIDYEIERNGYYLRMEWKKYPTHIPAGQAIVFDDLVRVPRRKFTVLCLAGDACTMEVTHGMRWRADTMPLWYPRDRAWRDEFFRRWERWAMKQPRWRP